MMTWKNCNKCPQREVQTSSGEEKCRGWESGMGLVLPWMIIKGKGCPSAEAEISKESQAKIT